MWAQISRIVGKPEELSLGRPRCGWKANTKCERVEWINLAQVMRCRITKPVEFLDWVRKCHLLKKGTAT